MTRPQSEITEIFIRYRSVLKPLIAEIESQDMLFPTAILNEIRSCFDHLSRCYCADTDKLEENLDRAGGHISRAILDSYKTLIVIYHDNIQKFEQQNRDKDWSTVDGGRFYRKFQALLGHAKRLYVEAKRQTDTEQQWLDTCRAYRKTVRFLDAPCHILIVKEGKRIRTWRQNLFWTVIGALISTLLPLLIRFMIGN